MTAIYGCLYLSLYSNSVYEIYTEHSLTLCDVHREHWTGSHARLEGDQRDDSQYTLHYLEERNQDKSLFS